MKRLIIIALALLCLFSFAACNMNADSAKKVKADYDAFKWTEATETAKVAKAQSLLTRINKLSATEQKELASIKTTLQGIVDAGTATPSPSPSASPSPAPSVSPSPSPSVSPSPTAGA